MSQDKLRDVYTSLLKAANMVVSSDGCVSVISGKESLPATVKGKRLVLPISSLLRSDPDENRIFFHPLNENIMRGVSDVMEMYKNCLSIHMNTIFGALYYQLMTLATSTKQHASLNPEQSEFLSYVKNADEKTVTAVGKIIQAFGNENNRKFISVYLKRSGSLKDSEGKDIQYRRLGIVSFPLYEELKKAIDVKGAVEIYGVKVRRIDLESMIGLYEYIMPNLGVKDFYSRGSSSEVAPFADALMKVVKDAGGCLNNAVELFSTYFDNVDELIINSDWVSDFADLSALRVLIDRVPPQPGNEGSIAEAANQVSQSNQVVQNTSAVTTQQPQQHNSVVMDYLNNRGQLPAHTPVTPFYTPPVANHLPMNGGMASPLVRTSRGVDFNSLQAINPALATAQPAQFSGLHVGIHNQSSYYNPGGNMGGNMGGYGYAEQRPTLGLRPY